MDQQAWEGVSHVHRVFISSVICDEMSHLSRRPPTRTEIVYPALVGAYEACRLALQHTDGVRCTGVLLRSLASLPESHRVKPDDGRRSQILERVRRNVVGYQCLPSSRLFRIVPNVTLTCLIQISMHETKKVV